MRWVSIAAVMVGGTSCVTSPFSGTQMQSGRVTSIEFTGQAVAEGRLTVAIQALEANGSWTTLGSGAVDADGNWSVPTQVAAHYFEPCNRAIFRALPSDGSLPLPGIANSCIQNLSVLPIDYSKCSTEFIQVTRPGVAPTTHAGDLSILGEAQAEQYSCYQTINGNLTLNGGKSKDVTLTHLQHVTGDVTLELHHFLQQTPSSSTHIVTKLHTPALTQIGGDVTLRAINDDPFQYPQYEFDLNQVTSLSGSVFVDNQTSFNHYSVFDNLTSVAGDVSIEWTSTDFIESGLMKNLTHIGGDLYVHPGGNIQSMLDKLTTVDGSVTIDADSGDLLAPYKMATSLTAVGGDVTLHSFGVPCDKAAFPNLTSVAGSLHLIEDQPRGTVGAAGLAVGALEMSNTLDKTLPLPAGFTVAPTGAVTVQGNANLCQCHVDAFLATLTAAGWGGVPTTPGNGTLASCAPCPMPSCL